MATSGIRLAKDAIVELQKMKTVTSSPYSGAILKFNSNNTEIVLDKTFEKSVKQPFREYKRLVKENMKSPRFAIIDLDFKGENKDAAMGVVSLDGNKVLLLSWVPDDMPVRLRMLSASTVESLKVELKGCVSIHKHIQLKEMSDFNLREILDKVAIKGDLKEFDGRRIEGSAPNCKYLDSDSD